jgi:hypothetical protein
MEIKFILGHADIVKICQIKDTQPARSCATYRLISYARKILNEEIYGRKKQGQLRKCWITCMVEDLRRMSIQGHRVKTQDQQLCRRFVREAKVNMGL